MVNMRNT
jgi:hypothetical protein